MTNIKEMDTDQLAALLTTGDAEQIYHTAICLYHEYKTDAFIAQNREDIFRLLAAAGYYGDAEMNQKIGNFFRFEFMEKTAKQYYEDAYLKNMEQAVQGNAAAQFALCEQRCSGLGVPVNMTDAAFWCMLAAHNGHKEAIKMMPNFWRSGEGLPVCEELAQKWEQVERTGPIPSKNNAPQKELLEAVTVQKALKEQKELTANSEARKKWKIIDLSKEPRGNYKNKIIRLIQGGLELILKVFMVIATAGLFTSIFTGYHESGILHWINRIYYLCVGLPFKLIQTVFGGEYTNFDIVQWNEILWVGEIKFESLWELVQIIFLSLMIVVLYCIVLGILYLVIRVIFWLIEILMGAAEDHGVSVLPTGTIDLHKTPDWLNGSADKAKIVRKQADRLGLSAYRDSDTRLLTLCVLTDFYGGDLDSALNRYQEILEKEEQPVKSTVPRLGSSSVGLRFALLNLLSEEVLSKKGIHGTSVRDTSVCYNNLIDFSENATFMEGYYYYRSGINYNYAEKDFQEILEKKPSSQEAAWATWFLAQMQRSAHLSLPGDRFHNEKHDQECLAKARDLEKNAAQKGCLAAMNSDAAFATRLFRGDISALNDFASHYVKHPQLRSYMKKQAEINKQRMHDCGYHFNQDTWNDYPTNCLWARFRALAPNNIIRDSDFIGSKNSKKLHEMMNIGACGLYCAKDIGSYLDLMDSIARNPSVSNTDGGMRQAQIDRDMRAYEAKLDERERTMDMLFGNGGFTEDELYSMGKVSDRDHLDHQFLRDQAKENYRRKLEKE